MVRAVSEVLRMGSPQLKQVLAGRWQVPLFVVSAAMLVTGMLRLNPERPNIPFDEAVDRVVALTDAEQFDTALAGLDLLETEEGRRPEELARLRRVRADTLFEQQERGRVPDAGAVREIIGAYTESREGGIPLGGTGHARLGEAYEWVAAWPQAIRQHRAAIEAGIERPLDLRRRIVDLLQNKVGADSATLHGELDSFIEASGESPEHLLWALERKVGLWASEDGNEQALALLERLKPQVSRSPVRDDAQFLEALTLFRLSRYEEAERNLRALRDRLNLSESLHCRSGWLLGEINLREQRPQPALAFFEDVLRSHGSGPYWVASLLGRATALAEMERFDESLAAFERVVAQLTAEQDSEVVSPVVVQTSLRTLSEKLMPEEDKLETAAEFTRLAASLIRPDDTRQRRGVLRSLAEINVAVARSKRRMAERLTAPEDKERRAELMRESRRYFAAAGDDYRELSRLVAFDEASSAEAAWQAVDMYDQAGLVDAHIRALREFILQRPQHAKIPDARFRLGRAYHVQGDYELAVEQYQQNLRDHSRTYAALQSTVELGSGYMAMGSSYYELAEEILLGLLDQSSGGDALVTPEAAEFRDALFLLAELYERRGEYEKAIARLEEALTRYPSDRRTTRARFLLADAYRHSAQGLAEELVKPAQATRRDDLDASRRERLGRAAELYDQVVAEYEARPPEERRTLEATLLQLSYFYRADCAFDLGAYERALGLYVEATWKYEQDPAALAGYVQIVSCHQRLGNTRDARRAIRKARVLTRKIPDEAFNRFGELGRVVGDAGTIGRNRRQWEKYFDWLAQSTLFNDVGA